jgi:hypothetical protein
MKLLASGEDTLANSAASSLRSQLHFQTLSALLPAACVESKKLHAVYAPIRNTLEFRTLPFFFHHLCYLRAPLFRTM